ncbi:MAG: hypothetical protein P1U45_02595 [Ponticaulis sp.]|nr:hypothetical protein [Ponticaulis sp.]
MAGISDIYYIGDLDFADVYEMERDDEPMPSVDVFSAKNLSLIELCELGQVLGLGSFDEMMAGFKDAFVDEDAGCGALIIPEKLVRKIKSLSVYEIGSAAEAWSKFEQFQHMLPPQTLSNPPKKRGLFARIFKLKTEVPIVQEPADNGVKPRLVEYLIKLQTFLKTRNETAYLFMTP